MKIYMAGKVPKGDTSRPFRDWRSYYYRELANTGAEFLTPVNAEVNKIGSKISFGFACYLVSRSDVVLVDGQRRLGVGTSQEMLIAKQMNKAVIVCLPPNSHYRRMRSCKEEWVHPFIECVADYILSSRDETVFFLRRLIGKQVSLPPIRGESVISNGIDEFLNSEVGKRIVASED